MRDQRAGTLLSVFLLATLARVEPRASVLCTLASTMALRAATAFLVHRTSPPDASRMARLKKAIGTTLSAFTAARTFWRVRTVPGWYRGFLRAGFGVGLGFPSPPFSPFCCFLVLTGRPIAFSITILRRSAYRDCSKRRTLAGSRGRHRAGTSEKPVALCSETHRKPGPQEKPFAQEAGIPEKPRPPSLGLTIVPEPQSKFGGSVMPGDGVRVVRFPGSPSILDPVSGASRTVTSERDLVHVLRRAASDVNTLYIVTDEDAPWCCSFVPNVLVVASPDSAIDSMRSLGRLAVRPSQPCPTQENRVSGRVPETALVGSLLARPAECPQNPVSGRVPETSVFPMRSGCPQNPVSGRVPETSVFRLGSRSGWVL